MLSRRAHVLRIGVAQFRSNPQAFLKCGQGLFAIAHRTVIHAELFVPRREIHSHAGRVAQARDDFIRCVNKLVVIIDGEFVIALLRGHARQVVISGGDSATCEQIVGAQFRRS